MSDTHATTEVSALIQWMRAYYQTPTVSNNAQYCLPQAQSLLRSILENGANPNEIVPQCYKSDFDDDMRGYVMEAMYKHRPLRMCIFILLEYGADPHLTLKGKSVVEKVATKIREGTRDATLIDLHARFCKMNITAALNASVAPPVPRKISRKI